MKLSDLFTKEAVTAEPAETLAAVAVRMKEHHVGTVVVTEDGRPVGILTDRDLALALGANGLSPQTPVAHVMSRHVLAIPEDAGIFTATRYIREGRVRRLPVVDAEDRVVGMVSLDDLLGCLASELANLVEGIKPEMVVK
jgi:CBS domain-containing protein